MKKRFFFLMPLAACAVLVGSNAFATEITVNSTAWETPMMGGGDGSWINGNCTFGEAMIAAGRNEATDGCPAGSHDQADTIHLPENGVINITSTWGNGSAEAVGSTSYGGETLIIEGHGATIQRAADAPNFRLMFLDGNITMRHLTLANGSARGTNQRDYGIDYQDSQGWGGAIKYWGSLTLEDCTLRGNSATGIGGAIYSHNRPRDGQLGVLIMNRCQVLDNRAASDGGALYLEGNGNISDSTFTNNAVTRADNWGMGGAISHSNGIGPQLNPQTGRYVGPQIQAVLQIHRSLFSNNSAGQGAAIRNSGSKRRSAQQPREPAGKLLVNKSTFINNTANRQAAISNQGHAFIYNSSILSNSGGGIENQGVRGRFPVGAYLLLANSTVANNTKIFEGAGIYNADGDSGLVINSTITGNSNSAGAGDGLNNAGRRFTFQNTILAGNGENDCRSPRVGLASLGSNIFGNMDSCRVSLGRGARADQVGVNPKLKELTGADDEVRGNEYFPLAADSPAINAGNPAVCVNSQQTPNLDKDQIGRGREAACDIGSAELTSIVHQWAFDEPRRVDDITLIPDVSGNSKDGQLNGANVVQDFVPGVSRNALQCDGVDNFVQTQQQVAVGVSDRWSISWWQNLNSVDAIQNIFTLGAPSENPDQNPLSYLDFIVTAGGSVSMNYTGGDGAANGLSSAEPALSAGAWQHIVLTNSGGDALDTIHLYVNGVEKVLNGAAQISPQGEQPRFINVCRDLNRDRRYVAGKMDDFMIRNRALSAAEVLAECQLGAQAAGIACGQ